MARLGQLLKAYQDMGIANADQAEDSSDVDFLGGNVVRVTIQCSQTLADAP